MIYQRYRYLYPPRPEMAVAPNTIPLYEESGWWAQAKMNGTCCIIYVPPDRRSFAMGRHGADNKLTWQPGARWKAFENTLPGQGWFVLVGELLHSKGVTDNNGEVIRDTVCLHDLLVDDGEYLIGQTYRHRFVRLCLRFGGYPEQGVMLAPTFHGGFRDTFQAYHKLPGKPAVEGLVFKNPDAPLALCVNAKANASWQHKCRIATDHLSF